MSRTKRLLAFVLTVLMAASMLTVMTFAAGTPVFSRDFVDPTGTITKEACLADPFVAGFKNGEKFVTNFSGETYEFTVGVNAFATIDEAIEGAEMQSESGTLQVILAAASYGDVTIKKPVDIFGVNWNVNPNTVNSSDPTKPWELNTAWNDSCTTVSNILISGSAIGETNVWGVKITGYLYDHQRPISSAQTKLTFKNILFSQTEEGTANKVTATTGRYSPAYAITFYNANSNNRAESGKRNTDEISLINWRFNNLAGEVNRLIDERVSPKFTIDGCYLDSRMTGFSSQGWWLKWGKFFQDCHFTVTNSCLKNTRAGNLLCFEGYVDSNIGDSGGKLPVGCGGSDQYSEFNITNNLLYDVVDGENELISAFIPSYSKIDISNNTVINTSTTSSSVFFDMLAADNTKDYSDIVTMRDNTVIGYSNYGFPYGNSQTKVDNTGSYVKSLYTDSWRSGTSNEFPSGKVRFDYCYLDAARTRKSNGLPPFTVNGLTPDNDAQTVELTADAGTLSITPAISGLGKYEIYESNADFTNAADYSRSTKVTECTLKNLKNYFLLIAYSYDNVTPYVYKLTVTKAQSTVDPGELTSTTPQAIIERDGTEYNVSVDRNTSDFSFSFTSSEVSVEKIENMSDSASITEDAGVYSVSDIEPNKTVTFRFLLSSDGQKEYFYVNISRGLSKKCDIVSANGVTITDTNMSATVPGNVSEFNFSIEISEGATASAWKGTTVYPMDENGGFSIGDLVSGLNVFTIGVVAENGVDYKLYTLTIDKEKNTEAILYSVDGAVKEGDGFTATARKQFTVKPTVSQGATFKVFADASCSQLIENNTVAISSDTTVYIIVTSESGTSVSAPVALTIKKSDDGISVAGQTVDPSDASLRVVKLEDNVKTAKLDITAKNASYKLYADKKLTTEAKSEITLDQGTTYLYAQVTYSDGETELITIKVISARTSIKYKDASKIPNWAKAYIDKLNASGTGILQGDAEGNFNASNGMTRYEIAAITVRLLGVDATQYAGVELKYTDAIAKWAENYVKAVTKLGIMGGSNNLEGQLVFDGKGNTTRAQLAKIIVELSFLDNEMVQTVDAYYTEHQQEVDSYYNSFDFADEASVQNWAKTYVKLAVYAKYFNGSNNDGRNYISGKDNIKRSEIAAVCTRYLGL